MRRVRDRRLFGPGPYVLGARLDEDRDSYATSLSAVQTAERCDLRAPVTFFVGDNGAGKSTLIEGIAAAFGFPVDGGPLDREVIRPDGWRDPLSGALRLTLSRRKPRHGFFLRAESFFNVAAVLDGRELSTYFGDTPLHEQSHGESFLALAGSSFGGEGLYVLDEPEAALSVPGALALLGIIHRACAEGSQFLIATHSPILLAVPGARIFAADRDAGWSEITFDDAEPVSLMRAFLDAPERMLRHLDVS